MRVAGTVLLLVMLSVNYALSAETDEKVLFMGFEKDKIVNGWLKLKEDKGDWCLVTWPGDRGKWYMALKKGDATEGEWAAAFDIGGEMFGNPIYGNYSAMLWNFLAPGFHANIAPPERFTAVAQSKDGLGLEGNVANLRQKLKFYTRFDEGGVKYSDEAFPKNWSGYNFLRVDVKLEKGEGSLRLAFEDDKVAPPIEKRFIVQGGKWVTCEIDLDEAVKERNLDLSKIINFWIFFEESKEKSLLYFDNARLSKTSAKTKNPVIKGMPKVSRPCAKMPEVDVKSLKPNRDKLVLAEPFKAEFKTFKDQPIGFIRLWAFDNNYMVMDSPYVVAPHFTSDGGKTWQSVKLPSEAAHFPGGVTSNRAAPTGIDESGRIYFLGNYGGCLYHCAPPVDSIYSRMLLFNGKEWEASPMYIVGGETRGCGQGRRIEILPGGRIWLAYRVNERAGPPRIHAVYSDDGGITWRGAGVDGKLTGTLADTLAGAGEPSHEDSGTRGMYCDPLNITQYQDQVAIISGNKWYYFDGKKWSMPAVVQSKLLSGKDWKVRYYSIATAAKKEIFLGLSNGLVSWDGAKWSDDEGAKSVFLTSCGDKVVGFSVGDTGKGEWQVLFWERGADGRWNSRSVASEKAEITFNCLGGDKKGCLAVPKHSPPNFAPVAWTCKGEKWIKVLRVPVQ